MHCVKLFRIIILLGCFFPAATSYAQIGKYLPRLVKPAQTIRATVQRMLGRVAQTSALPAASIAPLVFSPGQTLPALAGGTPFSIHPYPLPELSTEMYRGMKLDVKGEQLRYILKNGLEVDKTSAYLRESYDGKIYPPGTKAIFASDWVEEATAFAHPVQDTPVLSVVFHLKRVGKSFPAQIPHDIPTSWIYRVSAWLLVNGEARWGEIQLDKENNLIFKPYPLLEENP